MIFVRLLAVGGVVALVLWGMHGKSWINAVGFLFPFFSLAAAAAVASFEAQDGIQRSAVMLTLMALSAIAPGLLLAVADLARDASSLDPGWVFLTTPIYAFTLMVMLGWLFLPALYIGASLCRDWLHQRPASDAFLWASITVLFAAIWFTEVSEPFPTLQPLGPATLVFLFTGSAAAGAGLGWLFHRWTGYPIAR